jgi:hypothetical protein
VLSVRLWIRDEFVDVEGGEDEEWEIEGEGLGDCCGGWVDEGVVVGCWGEIDVVVVEVFKISFVLFWM